MSDENPPKGDDVADSGSSPEGAPVAGNELPNDDYKVGPGRPPLHSRFKRGQKSANPLGRPKGSLNLATIVRQAGNKRIRVKEGNRERTVSMMEIAAQQQWRKAGQGNIQSAKLMFEQVNKADNVQSDALPQLLIPKLDRSAMRRMVDRVMRSIEEKDDGPTPSA